MKYVFEDDERDIISKFFMEAFPKVVSSEFIYAKGNSNIHDIVKGLLENTSDIVVAFLDTIPGNRETFKIYNKLRSLSNRHQKRLIVMPIVCAEYYLIKSIYKSQVLEENNDINICINKDSYFKSQIIKDKNAKKFCKNFEKYCKLLLKIYPKECAKHTGMIYTFYGVYYNSDCLCKCADSECIQEELLGKTIRYISEYPCIPENSLALSSKSLSVNDLWIVHKELVDEYNTMESEYEAYDSGNITSYKKIKAF